MRRKIIKQGNNSYTMTLPISWIKENSLEGGSEIDLLEEENKLILARPRDAKHPESSISFDLNGYNERTILNIINQNYRKGYDKFILKTDNKDQKLTIKKIIKESILGFEVTENNKDHIIIQNIAEPSPDKFDVILRKTFFIIKDDGEELINKLKNNKKPNLTQFQENKDLMDNYTNFLRRITINAKIGGSRKSYLNYYFISELSHIQHAYFYLVKSIINNKTDAGFTNLVNETNKHFDLLETAYYKKDINLAHEISSNKTKLQKEIFNLLNQNNNKEATYHLGEIIRHTHLASTVLFGMMN
ncbi:hypothetical protein CMI38_02895 [Candidatus Pacearchaeota archaeon]|nr:hypothetical protein [Candidatus Pacearchaeota archaeon]|tara:strand:+ start:112 stop:1017 length:906 start_codon:yes stop_codon:yes gene_type:complete